jgi:hypothetical protein
MAEKVDSNGVVIRIFTEQSDARMRAQSFKGRIVDCRRSGYLVLRDDGIIIDADGRLDRDQCLRTAADLLMPADASLALAALRKS